MKFLNSVALVLLLVTPAVSQVINLKGYWKFHVGDMTSWSSPTFDDSKWESIYVPSPWEDEGFNGYDGFGWYRRKFDGKKLNKEQGYYLGLGFIDDCDEVYLNGKLIGLSGSMPPKFKTAYNNERKYALPPELIKFTGENTIAIRVFDTIHGGGIVDGQIGIFNAVENKKLLIDLQGIWSFAVSKQGEKPTNENEWVRLMVPAPWEHQGYFNYDGFAWYKRSFSIPANFTNEKLVLMLGKIDDFDKVYLNGKLIGVTNDHQSYGNSSSYDESRVYEIPPLLLKRNARNTIEVFVEDMGNVGGIYEGTIGITTMSSYNKHFKD